MSFPYVTLLKIYISSDDLLFLKSYSVELQRRELFDAP